MFGYLSGLVWGAEEETDAQSAVEAGKVEHSTHEEAGDWLVVTTDGDQSSDKGKSDTTSRESECDRESVCSDGSWIITPAPTFRVAGGQTATEPGSHPLENLLIEHPTMSVYGQVPQGERGEGTTDREEREREQERARARELVLMRNRQRYQVARQLQLPVGSNRNHQMLESAARPKTDGLRVTRKMTRRHNNVRQRNARARQITHVKKCSFVAGRRRS